MRYFKTITIATFLCLSFPALASDKLCPQVSPAPEIITSVLFDLTKAPTKETLTTDDTKWLIRAMNASQTTLRAYAASALAVSEDRRAIPYLIDALSDQSAHVGANYKEAGMSTTRYRAHESLKSITKQDFGYLWNGYPEGQETAIQKWKEWYSNINQKNEKTKITNCYLDTKEENSPLISKLDAIAIAAQAQQEQCLQVKGCTYRANHLKDTLNQKIAPDKDEWVIIVSYITGYFPDGQPQFMPGGFVIAHVSLDGKLLKIDPGL